jgi:hypothetical protein
MDLARQIKKWSEQVQADVAEAQKAACRELARSVIQDTPVQTGRARANWRAGLNQAPSGVLEETDPSGEAALQRVDEILARMKPGDSFVLVNNLDYAMELEEGSSQQAPHGMLKRNLQRWPELVEQAAQGGES